MRLEILGKSGGKGSAGAGNSTVQEHENAELNEEPEVLQRERKRGDKFIKRSSVQFKK